MNPSIRCEVGCVKNPEFPTTLVFVLTCCRILEYFLNNNVLNCKKKYISMNYVNKKENILYPLPSQSSHTTEVILLTISA